MRPAPTTASSSPVASSTAPLWIQDAGIFAILTALRFLPI